MKTPIDKIVAGCLILTMISSMSLLTLSAAPIIADHRCTAISSIPPQFIMQAKSTLHIAYGHTSHGSQITTGMSGLVSFMNDLGYPENLFTYTSGGTGGALDLRDTPFSGASDLGNPDRTAWESSTRTYLNTHQDVNVIIWSWCGQVDGSESDIDTYLNLMSGLERDYPGVKFVYMTGHLNGGGLSGNVNVRNQQIRDYCIANDKILFDFADIESFDPDGLTNYLVLMANDNCDYDSDGNGSRDANWALGWQDSHTENVHWYGCSSAHSQSLNANRKAYAAWWLWARLAGWGGEPGSSDTSSFPVIDKVEFTLHENYPNPFNPGTTVRFTLHRPGIVLMNIYNSLGVQITTLVSSQLTVGEHSIYWDASNYASGVYYYRFESGRSAETKKLLLVR